MISAFGVEHNTAISKAADPQKKSKWKRNTAIGVGAGVTGLGGYAAYRQVKANRAENALWNEPKDIFQDVKFNEVQFGKPAKKQWAKPAIARKGPIEEGLRLVAAKGTKVKI